MDVALPWHRLFFIGAIAAVLVMVTARVLGLGMGAPPDPPTPIHVLDCNRARRAADWAETAADVAEEARVAVDIAWGEAWLSASDDERDRGVAVFDRAAAKQDSATNRSIYAANVMSALARTACEQR